MALLLSYSQQQAIKKISENNEAKYAQIALEVEESELRKLIGVHLLQDLQANPAEVNNAKLLNGDTFTCNEISTKHKGLRFVLAYFNFSRYLGESYVNDTFTGFVKKKREESETLTEGEIKRLQNINRDIALTEWELIEKYLIANSTIFTKFCISETKKVYTPKIYGIRKTYR